MFCQIVQKGNGALKMHELKMQELKMTDGIPQKNRWISTHSIRKVAPWPSYTVWSRKKTHKVYSTVTLQQRVLESCGFHQNVQNLLGNTETKLEMWANAQSDGRPAEYRWSSLFNATKFGWRPLLECRAVTLPRRETRWNLQECPKLANRSQPLVGRSSPYYQDM